MQKSVRVGDYFDNDDNGLWSWYLTNIRNGDFEEFSKNKLKRTLLKRFLNEHFDPLKNRHHQSNTKILFVSIPDKVHRDLPLLENFLRDYFHLEHLEHIRITKLTKSKVYNHENHYILIDSVNNFEDPSFLRIVNSRWSQQRDIIGKEKEPETQRGSSNVNTKAKNNNINSNISNHSGNNHSNYNNIGSTNLFPADRGLNSTDKQMYGTVSEHPGSSSSNSLSSMQSYSRMLRNSSPGSHTSNLPLQRVEVKSILSESVNENFDSKSERFFKDALEDEDEDDDENEHESIVLNFSHSALQTQLEQKRLLQEQHLQRSSNLYTPNHSETVSISSFQDSLIDGSENDDEATNYSGQPLTLTVTRDDDDLVSDSYSSREEGSISELSSVSRSLHSLGSATSLDVDDDDDESSDYSILSILPSISISDPLGHFRLVLQSSLVQNPESKEVFTAIRQSNNEPTVADIEDDWLLYDSNFSMDNLQMLTLQDLLDTNRLFPKIIFYSMIVVSDHEILSDGSHVPLNPHYLVAPSQSTLSKFNASHEQLSGVDSEVSSSNEPKQFYPNSDEENGDNGDGDGDYDDTSLSEKSNPKMYAPTRIQSNATTAHRSIRTVNSIGDWAFLHDGDGNPQPRNNDDSAQEEQNVHFANGMNALHLSTTHTTSRNGLSKVSTIASMGSVERSKSTPLPIILKSLSIDNEGKRWKAKMDSFRRKRSRKHHHGEKNCTIM